MTFVKLKQLYFGYIMRIHDWLKNTRMLGKVEGRKIKEEDGK